MENRWLYAVVAAALAATASCGPRATPEECAGACRKYTSLLQANTGDPNITALEAIDREIKQLEQALERELEALDVALDSRLEKARDDDERTAVIEDYEERAEAKQEEYQPRFEALMEARALGGGTADARKVLENCIDDCLESRIMKSTADCQAGAAGLVEFHMCK